MHESVDGFEPESLRRIYTLCKAWSGLGYTVLDPHCPPSAASVAPTQPQ